MSELAAAMPTVKAGFFTSEFWLTALKAVVGLVLSSGIVPQGGQIGQIIGAVMAILAVQGWVYVRANLKKVAMDAGLAALKAVRDDVTQPAILTLNTSGGGSVTAPEAAALTSPPAPLLRGEGGTAPEQPGQP